MRVPVADSEHSTEGGEAVGRFDGKVAVVTGSGGGIGEAYAKLFAEEGARIVVAELVGDQGERVAKEIEQAGGTAIAVQTDVSSEESTLALAKTVGDTYGTVNYLVNNAAIFKGMEIHGLMDVPGHILAVDGGQIMRV